MSLVVEAKRSRASRRSLVGKVFAQAFLEHGAKLGVELAVFADQGLVFGLHHVGDAIIGPSPAAACRAARFSSMDSTRLVLPSRMAFTSRLSCSSSRLTFERQVGAVDHALHEAQVAGNRASASSMMKTRLT